MKEFNFKSKDELASYHKLIGERLLFIRKELYKTDNKFTQIYVATKINDLQSNISLAENGKILQKTLSKLILYYSSLGFNLNWIFLINNETISCKVIKILEY